MVDTQRGSPFYFASVLGVLSLLVLGNGIGNGTRLGITKNFGELIPRWYFRLGDGVVGSRHISFVGVD